MQVSVETINNELMTVVWNSSAFANVTSITQNNCGSWFWQPISNGGYCLFVNRPRVNAHEATALPPLPRHPTEDDAWLLYLYASHGLYATFGVYQFAHMDDDGEVYAYGNAGLDMISSPETTHCTNQQGNRVDVAIRDSN